MRPNGWVDNATRGLALMFASTPAFFLGAMLIYLFGVTMRWVPTFGFSGLSSYILPWLTLSVQPAAILSRVIRVGLEEAMAKPYATTAKSKGFARAVILLKDAMINVAPAFITAWGALLTAMVVGTIVVEPMFAWQGIGDLFLTGVRFRDFMIVQACLLIFITFFIVLSFAVDVAVSLADPKIRRQGAGN